MRARVWVVGSLNMDVVATASRLPRLGETLPADGLALHPGGKGANQAVAAARAGAPVTMLGALGRDPFGDTLSAFLAGDGIDLAGVTRTGDAPTGIALIVVAAGDGTIVVAPGANGTLGPEGLASLTPAPGDLVLTQLEIPAAAAEAALARARAAGAGTVLNAAPAVAHPIELRAAADTLVVNAGELGALAGRALTDETPVDDLVVVARAIRAAPAQTVVVTCGARGSVALDGDRAIVVPPVPAEAVDPTGAGDCFVGAFAARRAAGDALDASLRFASAAASLAVRRAGAGPAMPHHADIASLLDGSA